MLAALRRAGATVRILSVDRTPSAAAVRGLRAEIVVVDTIAAASATPIVGVLRRNGARIVTLALMSRGAVRLARRSDAAIAVSRTLGSELRAAGIPASRIAVIPPGTSRVTKARARRLGGLRTGRAVRVLCVANWTRAKGIHTLIAAARRVPEVSLDLVGAHPDARYARRMLAQIAHADLAGRIRVRGALTGARLERLHEAADIFVLPSTLESYGMAVGEALARGLPVIACDIAATREVTRGAAVLVPPGRVRPLTTSLRTIATDARRRDILSARASQRAKTLPSWERTERELARAVLRAVSARGADARRTRAGRPS
jgi:glycosyltransferase involved in cell wall biosynthesis